MEWKEWPTWVKGGVIGSILLGLPLVILEIFKERVISWEIVGKPSFIQKVYLLLHKLPAIITSPIQLSSRTLYIILALLIYFIIGALVGFIISKIKSSNEVQYKNV